MFPETTNPKEHLLSQIPEGDLNPLEIHYTEYLPSKSNRGTESIGD
jgi:hypothetical protein